MSGLSELLKKDISFKRKPSTKTAAKSPKTENPSTKTVATATTEEKAPKKRSLSLPKRTPKQPKAETPATKTEATAATEEKAPNKKKRSLSLPKRAPKQAKVTSAKTSSSGRHKQVVGLSVGASQLAAAVVVNNGRPKLVKVARHALPPEVVVGGEVRDSEALANEIAAFFSAADLPRKNVRLGIGSSRTGVRVFERPEVDDPRQLANAIRFRA